MLSNGPQPSSASTPMGPCRSSPQAMRGSSNQIFAPDGHPLPSPSPESAESNNTPRRAPPLSPTPPSSHHQASSPQNGHALQSPLEYHSGFSNADVDPLPSSQPSGHRRQQSFPVFFSRVFPGRGAPPPKHSPSLSEDMALTGDGRQGKSGTPGGGGGGLAAWLGAARTSASGASSEAGDSVVEDARKSSNDSERSNSGTPVAAGWRGQTRANDPATPKITVTSTASKFMSAITRFTQPLPSPTVDDELYNLDVEAALFPSGQPADQDTFSPAAYKNLQLNAAGILSKMQTAYRQRVIAFRELEGEKTAQQDELEEAETRAAHLKMQLEGMAEKAAEQEKAMQQLMEQLAAEKKARAEERLIRQSQKGLILPPEDPIVHDDIGVVDDRLRRAWRKSGETIKTDTSYETDDESVESESIFSRARSPTIPPSTIDGSVIDSVPPSSHLKGSSSTYSNATIKAKPTMQQMSAFQRIIKGISGDQGEGGVNSCRNCKGQDASVAWNTVSLLRDENKEMKQRVGELEAAVEGALDLVNGIGL